MFESVSTSTMHQPREFEGLFRRDRVAVHHMQRIASLPCRRASERRCRPRRNFGQHAFSIETPSRFFLAYFSAFLRIWPTCRRRQTAEQAGQAVPRARAMDIDELSEPPPRSPAIHPRGTPPNHASAVSSASRAPATAISVSRIRSAKRTKAQPFLASRHAAVV